MNSQHRELEQYIRGGLHRETSEIQAPQDLKSKIDIRISGCIKMEENNMRKISPKKLIIMVAAACLLVSTVCVAAGKVASTRSTSSRLNDIKDYGKLAEVEEQLGYPADAPESFTNGYRFAYMNISDREDLDENGNVLAKYKDLTITYDSADGNNLMLEIGKSGAEKGRIDSTREYQGLEIIYTKDFYKFVPVDYELTEEDKLNSEKDNYFISYGAPEVEEMVIQSVSWENNGIRYLIMDMLNVLGEDDLYGMAEETIGVK